MQFTRSPGDLGTSISSFIKEGRWEGAREGDRRGRGGREKEGLEERSEEGQA